MQIFGLQRIFWSVPQFPLSDCEGWRKSVDPLQLYLREEELPISIRLVAQDQKRMLSTKKNSLLLFVLGQRRRTIHNVNSWVYKFHQQLRIPLHFPPPQARSWKMSHTKNSFLDISIKEKQDLTTSLYPWEIPVLQLLLSTKIQGFISYSKLTVTKTGDTYQFFLVDTLPASKSGQAWCLH